MNYSLRDALDGVIKTGLMEKSVMVTYHDAKDAGKPYRLPEDSAHLLDAAIALYDKWVMEEIENPAMRGAAAVVAAHTIANNESWCGSWCDQPCTVATVMIWIED